MRKSILPIILLLVTVMLSCTDSDNWRMVAEIEKALTVPVFKPDTFVITDFGARAGDADFLNSRAIADAISACSANGGGVVLVPPGEWYTGPVTLLSDVNLHVSEGASVLFTTDYEEYLPPVLTRWEGMDCYNLHPFIYALGQANIAVTGKGVIDGQASDKYWWWMNGSPDFGWKEGMISQVSAGRPLLLLFEQKQTPVEERIFGIEDALRPQLVNIIDCKNVLIEDVTLMNSPFWVIHPLRTTNLTVRHVSISSAGPNSDGCDPESCDNVLIEDCHFNTGDDCIAIKSGRNFDGRRWSLPSKNIIVRGCHMAAGHGGVVIGSEVSGGFSNLFVEDCEMDSPDLLRVIRIKTSECRGGLIENVNVRNVRVGKCSEAILKINLRYEPDERCVKEFPPYVRNVTLENVTSQGSQYGILIVGLDSPSNVSGITLKDCVFNGVRTGNSVTGAEKVTMKNVYVNGSRAEI